MKRSLFVSALTLSLAATTWAAGWNVLDAGAAGDGATDCTAAFQKALDQAAAAGGGVVDVPAGKYRINGTLSIPSGVTLQGTFRVPPTATMDGSVLMAYAGRGSQEGAPFIRLAGCAATLAGVIVTYPEWSQSDVPPVPYPPTVLGERVDNNGVLDCLFLNSYEAIHFQNAGRFLVRNCYGYPSFRGLYVDACYDIGRVENCHFWPFGTAYAIEDPYSKWINVNGVAFEFARTDWQYCSNTFCFGYGVGYKFSKTENGSCNGNFLGIGADSCRRSVLIDTAPGTIDLLITNGEFVGRWGSADSVGVDIVGETTQRVSLSNCAFWGPLDRCIWARAPEAQLTATACGFSSWDVNGTGVAAVQVDSGKVILQGNNFVREGLHVQIAAAVQSALIMANQAGIGLRVDNQAGDRTQLVANETDSLVWTDDARRHYRIDVGSPGDGRYVGDCHGPESAGEWPDGGTKRWLGPEARLDLPVARGKKYVVAVDVAIPQYALDEANGLYLGDRQIAAFPAEAGPAVIEAELPRATEDHVTLTIRAKGWIPAQVIAGSTDQRQLSVALRTVTMRTKRAPSRVFDANSGAWIE